MVSRDAASGEIIGFVELWGTQTFSTQIFRSWFHWAHISLEKPALAALEMILLPLIGRIHPGGLEINELCSPFCLRVHLASAGPAQMEDFYFIFAFCSWKIHKNICIKALIIYSLGVCCFFFLVFLDLLSFSLGWKILHSNVDVNN